MERVTLDFLLGVVRFVILLITATVWAVIGFIFWVPLLARSTAVFSALILYVTLTNQDHRILGYQLEIATKFYIEGFRRIFEALYRPADAPPEGKPIDLQPWRIALETLWTVSFWFVLLFFTKTLGFFVSWFR